MNKRTPSRHWFDGESRRPPCGYCLLNFIYLPGCPTDLCHILYTILYKSDDFVIFPKQYDAGPTYEGGPELGLGYTHGSFSIGA